MSRKVYIIGASALMSVIAVIAITSTNSWGAQFNIWGATISVWLGSAVVAFILAAVGYYFRLQAGETPSWFFVAIVVLLVLCLVGGNFLTENSSTTAGVSQFRSSGVYYHFFGSTSRIVNSADLDSDDTGVNDDDLGYIAIVLIVVLLVIGSLIIPKFWVAVILGVLIVLWLFALKEALDPDS